jgi:hypothetical protein
VVEQLPRHPEVKGLSPDSAASTVRARKWREGERVDNFGIFKFFLSFSYILKDLLLIFEEIDEECNGTVKVDATPLSLTAFSIMALTILTLATIAFSITAFSITMSFSIPHSA